jgi:hypothetical protein
MKILGTYLFLLIGAMAFEEVVFIQPADAFPAYFFKFRKTRLPFDSCPRDARHTVEVLGLENKIVEPFGAGGTTATVRAFILCTRIPRGGPCEGQDGATVIFMSAGDNGPDATTMLDKMDATFGDSILIDCG